MPLKTTTWKDRNIPNLELTRKAAIERGIREPVIIDYGPGGSVSFMTGLLPKGDTSDLSFWKKLIRVTESFIRKTGLFRLVTTEPVELLKVFEELIPSKIIIVDVEPKVVKAANRLINKGFISIPAETHIKNMQNSTLGSEADIVIALNIVARTQNPDMTVQNIASSTRIGGVICINIDDPPPGFIKLDYCLFERVR